MSENVESLNAATATAIAPVTAKADYCSKVIVDEAAETVVDKTGHIFNGDGAHSMDQIKLCQVSEGTKWSISYMAFLN